jgi:DNA sulfur modification protein DndD
MKIESIHLKNFLCYYGENTLNFNDGLNLVLGANGYGKSKLYDAFQWVFKDGITSDRDISGIKYTSMLKKALISDRAILETQVGSSVNCEVQIQLAHQDEQYQLKRKYNINRIDEDNWLEANNSSLEVSKKDVIHFKPLNDQQAKDLLAKLLPSDVMPYVWFQGERGVNSIIDTNSKEALKRVIERLSDIDKWEDYIEISTKGYITAKKEFDLAFKSSGNNKKEAEEAIQEQSKINEKLGRLREELKTTQNNLELAHDRSNNVLGKHKSAEKIKDLKADLKIIQNKLKETTLELDSFHFQFTKNLFNKNWLLMDTKYLVDDFEAKYSKYADNVGLRKASLALGSNEQTRLPRGVPEKMHVQSMLEKQHCLVCDRPAPIDSPAYLAIKSLLPNLNSTINMMPDITSDLRRIWGASNSIAESSMNAETEIREAIDRRDYLIATQKELKREIERKDSEINTEIQNSGIEHPEDIINTVQGATQDIETYSASIGRLTRDIEASEKSLKHFENILKKLGKTDIDPKLSQKLEIMQDLNDLTIRLKDSQYQKLVELLETKANEHYARINKPTGAYYGKIKFQKTTGGGFIPEIFDDNNKRVDFLNTALISSMKLAIIMAIITANQYRGYADRYPLISDAPISDFDEKKSKFLLIETARTFGQSILMIKDFLTDDETRIERYSPDKEMLLNLAKDIYANGNKLSVQMLDLPDGLSATNRSEMKIEIRKVNLS